MQEKEYRSLFTELTHYEDVGISMKLDDSPASPMQIVTAHMLKEDRAYMRDYVWDEKGQLTGLIFHDIKRN